MGKIVGVLSLKGGVGKTSVVTALGDAIAGFDKKVILIDGNLSAPNLGPHLDVRNLKTTIHHVLSRKANLNDSIQKLDNLDVIPASVSFRTEINPFLLRSKIKPLKKKYDIILVDSPPTLNNESLAVILASDELLIVTTPDNPTLNTTLKSLRLAEKRGTPITGLIINKAHNKGFELPIDDIEKRAKVPVMAVIPYDIGVLEALSKTKASTSHKPKSEASTEYKKLGATLVGKKYNPFRLKDFFRKGPRRHEINRDIFYERVFKD